MSGRLYRKATSMTHQEYIVKQLKEINDKLAKIAKDIDVCGKCGRKGVSYENM